MNVIPNTWSAELANQNVSLLRVTTQLAGITINYLPAIISDELSISKDATNTIVLSFATFISIHPNI